MIDRKIIVKCSCDINIYHMQMEKSGYVDKTPKNPFWYICMTYLFALNHNSSSWYLSNF